MKGIRISRTFCWLCVLKLGLVLLVFSLMANQSPVAHAATKTDFEAASQAFQKGRFDEASKLYQRASQSNPGDAYAILGYGMSLRSLGRNAEAKGVLENLIRTRPDFAPAYYDLGLIYEAEGNAEAARRAYRGFIQNNPGGLPESPEMVMKFKRLGIL